MANTKCKIKKGMGGSRNGRSRWEKTEILKFDSKKSRRRQAKYEVEQEKEAFKISGRIVGTKNVTQAAYVKDHSYTSVVAAAVFVF